MPKEKPEDIQPVVTYQTEIIEIVRPVEMDMDDNDAKMDEKEMMDDDVSFNDDLFSGSSDDDDDDM
ncbi:MAG TPA: hypothetical protein PK134_01610 [Bacteroidia bacterium]|nr:hypothetical protein [Bacteroidia bacterium]HRA59577.1 hypothetical protein [Bacteroidia bacterium]HRB37581.1 hypothetical protein [Bacteroidia bacterium]HRC15281.1 hypothetical protein [Bacteroidia bacterium]